MKIKGGIVLSVISCVAIVTSASMAPVGTIVTPSNKAPVCMNQKVQEAMNMVTEQLIKNYIEHIVSFGPRVNGMPSCRDAGLYILDEFENLGLETEVQEWTAFGNIYNSFPYRGQNIEGTLLGTIGSDAQTIIFNAHYDTVKRTSGADDDASGTAAVLAAAYVLSHFSFMNTIRVVAVSGEEVGLLGSNAYARAAYDTGENVMVELNADMIGHAETRDGGSRFRVYATNETEWVKDRILTINEESGTMFNLTTGAINPRHGGSDYFSFVQYGFPSIAFFEFEWNPYMHEPQDDLENINLSYLVNTTRLIVGTIASLADEIDNPIEAQFSHPLHGRLYAGGSERLAFTKYRTVIIGGVTVEATVESTGTEISRAEFFLDENLSYVDTEAPFTWELSQWIVGTHEIKVTLYTTNDQSSTDWMDISILNLHRS